MLTAEGLRNGERASAYWWLVRLARQAQVVQPSRTAERVQVIDVGPGLFLAGVLLVENLGEVTADHEQGW